MMKKITEYLVQIAIVIGLVVAGIFLYQKISDRNAGEEVVRLREKVRADSAANEPLKIALARSNDSLRNAQAHAAGAIARWRAATRREAAAPPLPITASASDTAKRALADLKSCRDVRDSLATAIEPLQSKCETYKVDAEKRIVGLEKTVSDLDSLAKAKRPGKRWHLGPSAGFGYTVVPSGQADAGKDFQLERRLYVGISITRSVFSW